MTMNETGPWDAEAFEVLERWEPAWSTALERVTNDPWTGALDRKTVELVCVAINSACTNLNEDGTRRHIRRALEAGATRDELLTVLKMASLLSIHTCSLGAPILIEEAKAAGVAAKEKHAETRRVMGCEPPGNGMSHGTRSTRLTPFGLKRLSLAVLPFIPAPSWTRNSQNS